MEVVTVRNVGQVSIISINRPDKLNALSRQVAVDLQEAFVAFDASDQQVAILTGTGKNFTAGADVDDPPEFWRCVPGVGFDTDKPIIVAVEGWCVGGGVVLTMIADLCVAGASATFWYPEGRLGLTGGMISGLAARISHKAAMEMILLGRKIAAPRAYETGFVNEVVAEGEALDAALAMATELTALAPLVLRTVKRIVTQHIIPKGPSEIAGKAMREQEIIAQSEDLKEGRAAFREKRKATFSGK